MALKGKDITGILALKNALNIQQRRVTAITLVTRWGQFARVTVEYSPDLAELEGLGTLRKEYELRPIEPPELVAADGAIVDFADGQFGRHIGAIIRDSFQSDKSVDLLDLVANCAGDARAFGVDTRVSRNAGRVVA